MDDGGWATAGVQLKRSMRISIEMAPRDRESVCEKDNLTERAIAVNLLLQPT